MWQRIKAHPPQHEVPTREITAFSDYQICSMSLYLSGLLKGNFGDGNCDERAHQRSPFHKQPLTTCVERQFNSCHLRILTAPRKFDSEDTQQDTSNSPPQQVYTPQCTMHPTQIAKGREFRAAICWCYLITPSICNSDQCPVFSAAMGTSSILWGLDTDRYAGRCQWRRKGRRSLCVCGKLGRPLGGALCHMKAQWLSQALLLLMCSSFPARCAYLEWCKLNGR